MRALIASGTGRYADPWHPFPRTSPLIADALAAAGIEARIEHDVDAAMRSLAGVDLLVVNAGDPWRTDAGDAAVPAESIAGLAAALERGIGVLALHCAVASLRDYPEWAPAIGAMWVPGLSFHPPHGEVAVRGRGDGDGAGDGADAAVAGPTVPDFRVADFSVADFSVADERYCRLQRLGRSAVVAQFDGAESGDVEPAAWIREVGAARIAVDVLGHDERSYASAGHRRLLAQLARWALREEPSSV
ncbi:ThuA domain-containing protein [Microbacterium sp. W1N]|uniref:ThuA domain-containing protein n=1 Tax=Microbacterium festucae TaxID=2977531 RepID=UPI0021BF881C|nr:ThuA domain-containing protein [Microbacterium festucae]MCT9819177.1 ThuA domain-containing protein [Microbacterium festucae]